MLWSSDAQVTKLFFFRYEVIIHKINNWYLADLLIVKSLIVSLEINKTNLTIMLYYKVQRMSSAEQNRYNTTVTLKQSKEMYDKGE